MAEAPYQTYERVTGKKWTGGTSPEVASYLQQYGISAPAGSAEANMALQKALGTQGATQPSPPVTPQATLQATGSVLEPSLTQSGLTSQAPQTEAVQGSTALTGEIVDEQPVDAASILKSRYGIDTSSFDFLTQPERSLKDITMEVMGQTGLGDIQSRIQGYAKEIEDLENERNEKVTEINENPWLTEQLRQQKVAKLSDSYEGKINARINRLNLEKGVLDDAREQVNFAVQQAYNEAAKTRELRLTSLQDLMDRAEREATARQKLNEPIEVGQRLLQRQKDGSYKTVYEPPAEAQSYADLYGTGTIGEYNFYAQQERALGNRPLSFNEYQELDANRKRLASQTASETGLNSAQTSTFLRITDKFQADKVMENGNKGVGAIAIADQVLADPKNAGNQLKILYTMVKALDPESAVREGEIELASLTQSYLSKFASSFTKIDKGQVIAPDAATMLATATKELVQNWYQAAQRRQKQYTSQANVAGVGPAFQQYLGGFDQPYNQTGSGEEYEFNGTIYIDDGTGNFIPKVDGGSGQVGVADVKKVAEAIGKFESGGNYKAIGPPTRTGDKAYGKYQVMGANIPSWTREALGAAYTVAQFLASPKIQDAVALYKMGKLLAQYGNIADVASVWFSGRPVSKAGNAKDVIGTSVPQYVRNVESIYNQLG